MGSDRGFRISIEPKELLDRVSFGSGARAIKEELRDANAVVSLVDINNKLQESKETGCASLEFRKMPKADLESLLRSIPNGKGELVYATSMLASSYISHDSLLNYQTFVHLPGLLDINQLSQLFDSFSFSGVHNAAAYVAVYKDRGLRYVAFYVPPIVETVLKESVAIPLDNLRKQTDSEVVLQAYDGHQSIRLANVTGMWTGIMSNDAVKSVQVVRDGTHRLYLAHACGAPQYVITANGVLGDAPSVPVPTLMIAMTSSKPERKENRYLGLNEEGWTDEKFVGIDG